MTIELPPGQSSDNFWRVVNLGVKPSFGVDKKGSGEHFTEFRKNPWGKVHLFWDLGKSLMKLNSARVVAICPGKC